MSSVDPGKRCASPALPISAAPGKTASSWSRVPFCLAQEAGGDGDSGCELLKPHDLHIASQSLPPVLVLTVGTTRALEFLASSVVPTLLWPPQLGVDWGPGEQHARPSVLPSRGLPVSS